MRTNDGGIRFSAWARRAATLAMALLLAGCYESHLARRQTMSIHGGDAVATNIILQTIDPWPPGAWDKSIAHDGTRMVNAIDKYHDPKAGQPAAAGPIEALMGGGGGDGMTTN